MRLHHGGFLHAGFALVAFIAIVSLVSAHPGLHHDIERISRLLEFDPDSVPLLLERGYLRRLDGDAEKALDDLQRARVLAPSNLDIARQLGLTLSALRRDAEAEKELTRHIAGGNPAADTLAERARIHARNNRPDAALIDYADSLALFGDIDVYLERSRLQISLGRFEAAAAGLRSGLNRTGGAVSIRLALIRVETQRAEYDEVLKLIDEMLFRQGIKTQWLMRRGHVLRVAGRVRQADQAFTEALSEANRVLSRNRSAIHLVSRAKVYRAMGRRAEAVVDLQAAIVRSPRYTEAVATLKELQAEGREQP